MLTEKVIRVADTAKTKKERIKIWNLENVNSFVAAESLENNTILKFFAIYSPILYNFTKL